MCRKKNIITKTGFVILFFFMCAALSFSQIGGNSVYEFLNLPNSARVTALGGDIISVKDDDLNLAFYNPSLLSPGMDNKIVLNYSKYFAGINYGYTAFGKTYKDLGTFSAGLHYINYGEFVEADETGTITGNFTAGEYLGHISFARPIDSMLSIGASLKGIYSSLERYTSFGMALDLGATYHNPELFTISFVMKNIGSQFTLYNDTKEPLPFNIQLGISKKLKHAPFRLILLANHLQRFNLQYEDPNNPEPDFDPITGEPIQEKKFQDFADNVGRHMVIGVELIPFESFYVRFGYNYKRRKEMMLVTRPFLVGMSIGAGVKISKFHISYGRALYHMAGAVNQFSIGTNLTDFHKKSSPDGL